MNWKLSLMTGLCSCAVLSAVAADSAPVPVPAPATVKPSAGVRFKRPQIDETLVREGIASLRRAADFLLKRQMPDGSWFKNPAMTGLSCMALNQTGIAMDPKVRKEAIEKGRAFILKHVQPDGSIWMTESAREYPTYTTAITLTCLATLGYPEDEAVLRAGRRFLLSLQLDENNPVVPTSKDDPKYGGFGYGPDPRAAAHVDLSNTQWVAEALHATDYLDQEPKAKSPEDTKKSDMAWDKLASFVSKMQHLPETNQAVWVVSDPKSEERGGFIYHVEGDGTDQKTGQAQTLRSYGSMTYAGLKSMLYAKLKKDDPRVKAAVEWASKHYTLSENPGQGAAGHYYYLQTFAKAHSALMEDLVKDAKGNMRNWRSDLIKKLLELQKGNGEWQNDKNGRWWESSPELVTAYSMLSMELALGPYLNGVD